VGLKSAFPRIAAGLSCRPRRTRTSQPKKRNIHSNQQDKFLDEDDQYHPVYGLSRIFGNENLNKTSVSEGSGRNFHILNSFTQGPQNAGRTWLYHPPAGARKTFQLTRRRKLSKSILMAL
jgi:hypothetical protein